MPAEDFREMDEFITLYMSIPCSSVHSDVNFAGLDRNGFEIHHVFDWLKNHYDRCEFFNGFSIARPPNDRRGEGVIVRCSCGSFQVISMDLWHIRIRNKDIEDIIENLNYSARVAIGANYNMKERLEYFVNLEILRRKMKEEAEAKNMCSKAKEKNGLNPIFSLEV
jgi:hypothetical protein